MNADVSLTSAWIFFQKSQTEPRPKQLINCDAVQHLSATGTDEALCRLPLVRLNPVAGTGDAAILEF